MWCSCFLQDVPVRWEDRTNVWHDMNVWQSPLSCEMCYSRLENWNKESSGISEWEPIPRKFLQMLVFIHEIHWTGYAVTCFGMVCIVLLLLIYLAMPLIPWLLLLSILSQTFSKYTDCKRSDMHTLWRWQTFILPSLEIGWCKKQIPNETFLRPELRWYLAGQQWAVLTTALDSLDFVVVFEI